ncbi:hypothetical protein K8S19_04840 [bacterium]|nr:hypothetical protein [bacterium]
MKTDWTIRWWDVIALTVAMGAAVMAVQYAISRGTTPSKISKVAVIEVRVTKPLPEIVALISPADAVVNRQGNKVAEIISVQPVPAKDGLPLAVPLAGQQDVIIKLRVEGALQVVRNTPGFPREATGLKAGAWCLISTQKVELSGIIISVIYVQEEHSVAFL